MQLLQSCRQIATNNSTIVTTIFSARRTRFCRWRWHNMARIPSRTHGLTCTGSPTPIQSPQTRSESKHHKGRNAYVIIMLVPSFVNIGQILINSTEKDNQTPFLGGIDDKFICGNALHDIFRNTHLILLCIYPIYYGWVNYMGKI